jgi:hypothetical protein
MLTELSWLNYASVAQKFTCILQGGYVLFQIILFDTMKETFTVLYVQVEVENNEFGRDLVCFLEGI